MTYCTANIWFPSCYRAEEDNITFPTIGTLLEDREDCLCHIDHARHIGCPHIANDLGRNIRRSLDPGHEASGLCQNLIMLTDVKLLRVVY